LSIQVKGNDIVLPRSIHILLIYVILESIKKDLSIENNLARTFGSFIVKGGKCNKDIKNKLKLTKKDNTLDTVLIQDNIEDKYLNLNEYMNSVNFKIDDLHIILLSVLRIIYSIFKTKYKIIHNNLKPENIYVNFDNGETIQVKIINFDNASFSINNKRFNTYSETTYSFPTLMDNINRSIPGFDKVFYHDHGIELADLLMMYS
jgi:serine/threonine protein kinase